MNETCKNFVIDNRSNANLFLLISFLSITTLYVFGLYKSEYFMARLLYTINCGWFFARLFNSFHIWCELDIFTVYFIIWQFMSLMIKWQIERFPLFSLNFYRGCLCIVTAFEGFLAYDAIFRYLPLYVNFGCMWILSIEDM